jgi:antitoxin PrlF
MARVAVLEEFEVTSKITDKGQTTVPKAVRNALGVHEGDQIAFKVSPSGVSLRRADAVREDPAIAAFLSFLARDMENSPQNLKALTPDLAKRIADLVEGIEVDLHAPIDGDVDL